jgi:serine/threonine protein kinase
MIVHYGGLPFGVGHVVLKKYRLSEFIHMGGMGVIFKAVELSSGNVVVVKFPRLNGDRDVDPLMNKNKLETEADILSEIWNSYGGHPHIVKFLEKGSEGTYPVLVTEFVDGERLVDIAKKQNGLPADLAYDIGLKLAEALSFLHSKNILHRDLAPDNIMIRKGSYDPVIIDFGTAKLGYIQSRTKIMGKSIHPIELETGHAVAASDVYMWAATLMTIMKPFTYNFKDYLKLVRGGVVLRDEPMNLVDLSALPPDRRREFNDILKKCLNSDPSKRFASGRELLDALRQGIVTPAISDHYIVVNGIRVFLKPDKKYVIGTEGDIKVIDPHKYVSRRHVELSFDRSKGKWIVSDCGSTNGTIVVKRDGPHIVSQGHRGSGVPPHMRPVELDSDDKIVLAYRDRGGNNYDYYLVIPFY